jgi:hypothetical protein
MTRWACVLPLLICASLAGCASAAVVHPGSFTGPVLVGTSSSSSGLPPAGSAEANRDKATKEAQRLLERVVIPPGAVALAKAPSSLPGPALGAPGVQTYVDLSRFYRVPLSFQDTLAYVKMHPPAGVTDSGSSRGGSAPTVGLAWDGKDADDPSTSGQLSVVMAPAGSASTYFRVDAGHYWLDPRPTRDTTSGLRLRIESGGSCPASDTRAVGVRNSGDDLSRELTPDSTANDGRICFYDGMNGAAPFALSHSRTLTAAEAGRLGRLAHEVDLSHSDGSFMHCPMDDRSAAVLILAYPNRPAVDIWLHERGCASVSNGQVGASGSNSMAALVDAVQAFAH